MYMFFWGSIPRLPTESTNNKNSNSRDSMDYMEYWYHSMDFGNDIPVDSDDFDNYNFD